MSRVIENAEFVCSLEKWKGYIIAYNPYEHENGAYVFCPLSQKNRDSHAGRIVHVVRRK